jgi:hypothetical protein
MLLHLKLYVFLYTMLFSMTIFSAIFCLLLRYSRFLAQLRAVGTRLHSKTIVPCIRQNLLKKTFLPKF